jgi:drug/metabolite transporter (DMT)-like permease
MSEALPQPRIGRSILAVLAGLVVGAALSIGTDIVLHTAGIFPPLGRLMADSLLLLATAYRTIYSVLGAYITARLAPNRPMQHALVLGALGLVVCLIGVVTTWNRAQEFGPHWYPIALTILALPQCWLGGKLFIMQSQSRPTV